MTLLLLKLFISITILCGLYFYARKDKNKHRFKSNANRVDSADRSNRQASRHLQIKLLQLLHGDRHAANRLIALAKTRNPSKSIDWCVEKVIFDLQRDRGRY